MLASVNVSAPNWWIGWWREKGVSYNRWNVGQRGRCYCRGGGVRQSLGPWEGPRGGGGETAGGTAVAN